MRWTRQRCGDGGVKARWAGWCGDARPCLGRFDLKRQQGGGGGGGGGDGDSS